MGIYWSKLFMKAVLWVFTEVTLTCLGLDDLADYSEFVIQDRSSSSVEMTYVANSVV